MKSELDYNEVILFMKKFGIDYMNRFNEFIIDEQDNIYTTLEHCKTIQDIETSVVFALCRPIGKGLSKIKAKRLLIKVNKYFNANLTRDDMHLMYRRLCYVDKFDEFKDFIRRGFPMGELSWHSS